MYSPQRMEVGSAGPFCRGRLVEEVSEFLPIYESVSIDSKHMRCLDAMSQLGGSKSYPHVLKTTDQC